MGNDLLKGWGLLEDEKQDEAASNPLSEWGLGEDTEEGPLERAASLFEPVKTAAAYGMRFISSQLEPLYLPQQILFAAASGDWSKLSLENLAKFAPGGAEPELKSGKEVLNAWGVKGKAATIGGLVLDFFADPILVGGYLTALGKATKAEKLIQLGKAADEMVKFAHPYSAAYAVAPKAGKVSVSGGKTISDFVSDAVEWALELPVPVAARPVRRSGAALPQTRHYTVGDMLFSMNPVVQRDYPWLLDSITESNGKMHAMMTETKKVVEYHQQKLATLGDDMLAKKTNEIVGKYLEKMGELSVEQVDPVLKLLDKQASAKSVRSYEEFEPEVREIFEVAANRKKYLAELKRAYEASDKKVSWDEYLKTADDLAAKWFAHRVSIAHELTDYSTFAKVLDTTASVPRHEALLEITKYYFARDGWEETLKAAEKERDPVKRQQLLEAAKEYEDLVSQSVEQNPWIKDFESKIETDMPLFNNVKVSTYIRSLFDGYLRKVSTIHASDPDNLAMLMSKLQKDAVIPFKELDEDGLKALDEALATLIKDENMREGVRNYVTSGANIIDVYEMSSWMSKKYGIDTVEADNLVRYLGYVLDPEAEAKLKTMKAVAKVQDASRRAIQGDVYSLRTDQWVRDVADEAWNYLAEAEGVLERSQSLALSAAIPIRAKDMFRSVYDELSRTGQIHDAVDIGSRSGGRVVIDGVTYLALPGGASGKDWGALAGKYIPEKVYRELAIVSSAPSSTVRELKRLLGLVRAGYISTASAVGHNVVGNITLAYMRGVAPSDYVKYGKRAKQILEEAATSGFSRELEEAGFKLNFFHTTAAARELGDLLFDEMTALAKRGADRGTAAKIIGGFSDAVNNIHTKLTQNPKLGGFLPWFQYAEDFVRTVAYLKARDVTGSVRDAVRYANDITFNYARLPRMIEYVRNTGFSLFPAFPYYMFQRSVEATVKNPRQIYVLDKIPLTINNATLDKNDKERLKYGLLDYWLGKTRSIIFKGSNGQYYFLPMDYVMPHTGVNIDSAADMTNDVISGGVYRPVVDIVNALMTGGKTTEYSSRFGRTEVYPPDATAGEKALGIASYLVTSYAPGTLFRGVLPAAQKLYQHGGFELDPETSERAARIGGRYLDLEPMQVLGQIIGFKPRKVGDVTFNRIGKNIRYKLYDDIGRLKREYRDKQAVILAKMQTASTPEEAELYRKQFAALSDELNARVREIEQKYMDLNDSYIKSWEMAK